MTEEFQIEDEKNVDTDDKITMVVLSAYNINCSIDGFLHDLKKIADAVPEEHRANAEWEFEGVSLGYTREATPEEIAEEVERQADLERLRKERELSYEREEYERLKAKFEPQSQVA